VATLVEKLFDATRIVQSALFEVQVDVTVDLNDVLAEVGEERRCHKQLLYDICLATAIRTALRR
jgi:hypothetical protein